MVKEILRISFADYYIYQKINYLKYLFSKKSPTLKYKPITISIVGTSRCTLACDMCPTHSPVVPKDYKWRQTVAQDIDFRLFKKTVDLFKEALSVHIIGSGEPLLNKDFFDMVRYASCDRKMEVKTFSNGTTVGDNMERLLHSELDGLTISINGHNGLEFSRMTGMPQETFKKIYDSAKKLIQKKNKAEKKLKVKLSFIIDKINYKFLPDMVRVSQELEADHTFFCNFLPCFYGELVPQKRVIMKSDREIVSFIEDFKRGLPDAAREKLSFPSIIDPEMKGHKCDVHFRQIRIDGDGNVSSCSMMLLNMEEAGNINREDCWNCGFLVKMRERFLEGKDIEELCHYCSDNKGIEV